MRRLELVATENTAIFGATSAHQWITYCAEAAPVAPGTSLFFGVPTTRRGFSNVEYMHVSSARRNRSHTAQPTQLVTDERMSSAVYCRKLFARKVQWAHCVTKRHIPHKRLICRYVRTSAQPRRLSGCKSKKSKKYVYFVKNIGLHVNITKIAQYKHFKKYVHIHLRHGGSIKMAYAIACMRAP